MEKTFHEKLQEKIDKFIHLSYGATRKFPKEELYGVTSQLRRAVLSVGLNYTEGYARNRNLVLINFLEIAYGSLKESSYLLSFSFKEGYLKQPEHKQLADLAHEIGAMLWGTIQKLKAK